MVLLRGRELIHNAFETKIFSWPSSKSGESDKSGHQTNQANQSSKNFQAITMNKITSQ